MYIDNPVCFIQNMCSLYKDLCYKTFTTKYFLHTCVERKVKVYNTGQ
jgi:hypothetical protein